jgi:hypothetical protein
LKTLVEGDVKNLEAAMESAGAPWMPGRVPEWKQKQEFCLYCIMENDIRWIRRFSNFIKALEQSAKLLHKRSTRNWKNKE